MKKKKRTQHNFLTDYIKAVKKVMRETVGLQPTRIKQSVKAYNRNKTKQDVRKILKDL
jgi:hypothetical protein